MHFARFLTPIVALALSATPAFAASPAPDVTPWLGITLKGTEVLKVTQPSPASVAGMEPSDRVISVNGMPTETGREVLRGVQTGVIGDFAVIRIARGDKRLSLAVFLAPKPEIISQAPTEPTPAPPSRVAPSAAPTPAPAFDPRFPMLGSPPPAPAPRNAAPPTRAAPFTRAPQPRQVAAAPDTVSDFDLADHKGNVLVVQVMASWCGACSTTVADLNRWHETYADQGVTVIALSSERRSTIEQHRKRAGIRVASAHDLGGAWAKRWRVTALPTFLVFDRAGRLVETVRGAGSGVRRTETAFKSLLDPGGPSFVAPRR